MTRKSSSTQKLNFAAKWAHKRADCIAALRAGYSAGAVARAYETPETAIRNWQKEEGIPAYKGKPRPMPDVGTVLA